MVIKNIRTLSHNNTAHEHLNRPDAFEGDLALARGVIQTELLPQLILTDRIRVVDLVAQDDKGHLGQLLHRQESVELDLGLGKALVVLGINEEDDAVHLGEVVSPDTAS